MMNEAVRFLKKYKGNTVPIENVPEEGAEDQIEDLDLKRALGMLNQEERSVVVLRYFEDEKISTIAGMLNLNENTVKSRLYRAVEKLKKHMETGGAKV